MIHAVYIVVFRSSGYTKYFHRTDTGSNADKFSIFFCRKEFEVNFSKWLCSQCPRVQYKCTFSLIETPVVLFLEPDSNESSFFFFVIHDLEYCLRYSRWKYEFFFSSPPPPEKFETRHSQSEKIPLPVVLRGKIMIC